jgi:hypothetical protein
MRDVKHVLVACVIAAFAAGNSGAADYETQFNKPAKNAVSPAIAAGPNYKVNAPVVADGYMYRFTVTSPYGPFEVTGTGALQKLEQEIWAIGQLKNVTRSEAFLKSLKDQAGKPLVFAKDVITKPVDTLSGIPKGVARLFGNIATSVTSTRNPSQESRANEVLLVGSFKRDYASRYGVDPYSSNQVLQDELDKIGKAAAFGSWTATVAQTKAGLAMIPFALDYGVWTANADRLSQNMKTTYAGPGFNGNFQLWVTGFLSPKGKQELEARGFAVVEQVGSRFEIID